MKQTLKWILNLTLFVGFVLAFYLDFTGLAFHQWLGVVLGGFALVHLAMHWIWVKKVYKKFAGLGWQPRLNLLMDAGLMLGLFLILLTGVVISTWFNLTLNNYGVWRDLHVAFSVETLLAVLIKLGLHWKVIVLQVKKIFRKRENVPVSVSSPVLVNAVRPQTVNGRLVSRRDFIAMMSVVSVVSTVAISHVLRRGDEVALAQFSNSSTVSSTSQSPSTAVNQVETTATETESVTTFQSPSATPQPTVQPTSVPACTVRCPNGCSFPGRCRRYTDSNGNGKCDLGECL